MLSKKPLSATIALLLATSVAAQAQSPAAETDDAKTLDAVTVTGTNLRGVDLAEAQPVQVIDAVKIERLGLASIGDVLKLISETGGGTGNFSTATSGALQADSPAGMAGASLRGLGAGSTLTLVNGRRVAASSFSNGVRSENFVDINAIPMAAVERIEVLSAGASAIYGADAVAGVINVVLRQSFDGVRTAVSIGDSTADGDEAKLNANLLAGFSTDTVEGLVVIDAFRRNGFYNRDRAITANERVPSQQGIFPSYNWGSFSRDDFVEASCPSGQRFDGRPGFPLGSLGAYCAVDRSDYTAFDPQLEQLGLYGTFNARLGDSLAFFSEVQLQRNESFATSAPAPWSQATIAFNHPNMPAELRTRLLAGGLGATQDIVGWGRFPDERQIDVETKNWRALAGLRGELNDDWGWEAAVGYGRSESEQIASGGIYNRLRTLAALRGRLCADGTTTCTPTTGGLWYNPFGGQATQDPNVMRLLRDTVPRNGESTTLSADLKFNGIAGAIGDRDIAWAVGLEGRREDIADRPSPLAEVNRLTGQPGVFGFGSKSANADRNASAVFVESLLPFTDTFDVRLAGRYDHYSDFGGDFNPSVGLRFRPSDALVFRAGWNTGFRAPSLAQAGSGTTAASFTLPCASGSEFFANWCGSRSGRPTILSQVLANPDLQPETSEAWNAGMVWSPLERTTVSIDYWNFDQKNTVDVDYFGLLRAALTNPSLIYTFADGSRPRPVNAPGIETASGGVGRVSTGEVFAPLQNIGVQRTNGWDLAIDHGLAEDFLGGRLDLSIDATRVLSFERSESCSPQVAPLRGDGACVGGQRLVELNGEYRYPKWRGTVALDWTSEDFDAALWASYTGSYYDDFRFDPAAIATTARVASWTTFNASWGWNINETHRVSLQVKNLTDRDPPRALGASAWVDTFNHDAMGRFVTLNWIGRF
ncbi:TonB-dependent receptor [Silanimonas sp.]|uniref:TonB-dependent receptor plug domain-containing protein n=1 Tax=Silanimonas sp. TaxID=1929290 RepID=UPI0022C71A98|nr:TonB-dependent receptor [Silanimonas sp.]MCZ8061820.1 TonB-dependent receptor [Silanimonas sp.]